MAAPRRRTDVVAMLLAGVVALDGVLRLAAAWAGHLAGHHLPRGHLLASLVALMHLGEPSQAWGKAVAGAALYWSVTGLVLLACGLLAEGLRRLMRVNRRSLEQPLRPVEGLADRRQVRRAAGAKALVARAYTLRPNTPNPSPNDVGFLLGRSRGVECWASVEDSVLLVGPPRSGKGQCVVIPSILDAPGPVITTSTRPDNVAATISARGRLGPVAVFDPERLAEAPSVVRPLRWSPIRGCDKPQVAMARADALIGDGSRSGVDDAKFWRTQAVTAMRCLLHAAALGRKDASDLYRWSHAAPLAREAVQILTRLPSSAVGWDRGLDAIVGADERMRDSTWAMISNALSPLADPDVLRSVTPPEDEQFQPADFLARRGTLYLLGTSSEASSTANLVAALAEDVISVARQTASASPASRLDPPLALILDEAANYPLPSLPRLMSEGGGSGIATIAVLQSLAQARDRWGREAASVIWDSAIVKLILGGSANSDDLSDLSKLIGERAVRETSETVTSWDSGRSVSTSVRYRPILEPADIRRIPVGTGLLLLRSASPMMLDLRSWTTRKDAHRLRSEREIFEAEVRRYRLSLSADVSGA